MQDREARVLERREIYDGRVVRLGVERVLLPNGKTAKLEVIRHQGAAAVVPIDEAGNVYLVRQYRHAAGGWLLEVPAGKLEPGETPEECVRREIEEETGRRAGRMTPLGSILTTPGFTDERIWLFLATELEEGRQALEDHEPIVVETMPFMEALERVASGEICDAKSVVSLLQAEKMVPGLQDAS